MKKIFYLPTTLIIIAILFTGCNNLNILNFQSKKPNNFYYTEMLLKNLSEEKNPKCIIVETNFHKEKQLENDMINDITIMFKSLNKKNFITVPKSLPKKPAYKILLIFKKEKLLINIYNSKYISVYPWDGVYSMDYISTGNIPISLNLYNLGNYIFK